MAKITRATQVIFGGDGSADNFAKFGSQTAGTPVKTKDPATIQALAAWADGLQEAVWPTNKAPFLEDLNSVFFLHSRQVAYVLQEGIPEWDSATTYYTGSIVKKAGTTQLYGSKIDTNVGNALPNQVDDANWSYLTPAVLRDGGVTVGAIPKVSSASPAVMVDSAISDDGVNVGIDLPLKFPDNTTQATAAAPITTQNSVTGSRALGIVYQNTSGKPMMVTVAVAMAPGQVIDVYTDAAVNPTTYIGQVGNNTNPSEYGAISFWVLPGNYYKVTGTAGIEAWTEWT